MSQTDYIDYYDWGRGIWIGVLEFGFGIEDWGLGFGIWIWDWEWGLGIGA